MDRERQTKAPIYEALEAFKKKRVVPFDVPGHKRGREMCIRDRSAWMAELLCWHQQVLMILRMAVSSSTATHWNSIRTVSYTHLADMLLSESLRIFAERCSCTKYRIIRNGSAGFGNPSGFLFIYLFSCPKTTIRVHLLDMSRGLLNNESRAID